MLDDELPHLVVQVQVSTGDEAGDDDDGGAADQLLLSRPFDLLQLCPGLLEEADAGGAGADLVAALATRGGRLSRRLLLGGRARPGRGPERRRAFGLRAALAALLTGRAGHYLPRLPVQRMATAPAAVLAELDAVRRIALRLLRLVVPAPALGTGERDCDSDSGCHFCSRSEGRAPVAPGGLEPPTSAL